jgi:hypothetical protein
MVLMTVVVGLLAWLAVSAALGVVIGRAAALRDRSGPPLLTMDRGNERLRLIG